MIINSRFFLSIQVWALAMTALWLCAPAMGQTFVTSDPAVAIGSPSAPTSQTIVVPVGTGIIVDLDTSFFFSNSGAFGSEMEFSLQSPTGTQVLLWDGSLVNGGGSITTGAGGTGTYYFDDDASALSDSNISPILAAYAPGNLDGSTLADFNGEVSDGTWTLIASTVWGGQVSDFSLFIEVEEVAEVAEVVEKVEPTILVADNGAINSLQTTGVLMPAVQQQAVQGAAQGATADLNSRLFRARSGKGQSAAGASSDAPISRYLDFAARNQISYRFAIGLEDEDRKPAATSEKRSTSRSQAGGAETGLSREVKAGDQVAYGDKSVLGGKVAFDDSVDSEWEVFTEVDYGFYDQDNLSAVARGFRSNSYAASVGVEHAFLPWLYVGGAVSRLQSDTELEANLGGTDLDGTLLSAYFTAFHENFYFDFLYSYGNYDNEVKRNTLLGSTATGSTDSYSDNVDLNLGYVHELTDQIRTGPIAGFNYTLGQIDGYTEAGGGTANLVYGDSDFESMVGRIGWQITLTDKIPAGRLTTQFIAQFANEFRPESGATQVSLLNSPFALVGPGGTQPVGGLGTTATGPHVGQDWFELGTVIRLDLENQWNVSVDYSGQFGRDDASAHFVGARLGYEW